MHALCLHSLLLLHICLTYVCRPCSLLVVLGLGMASAGICVGESGILDGVACPCCFCWVSFRLQCPPFLSGAFPSDGMDSRKALA